MRKYFTLFLAAALTMPVALAVASQPSHPLSHIHPIDENFNMSDKYIYNLSMVKMNDGTVSGTALVMDDYRLRDEGNNYVLRLDTGTGQWRIEGSDLNLSDNNLQNPTKIENYFSNSCGENYVVEGLNSDGSYSCVQITNEMQDIYVNETGDLMTGDLDMTQNDIENVRKLNFADVNGDATSFNITETGGDLKLRRDGSERLNILKSGGVSVKNGKLTISDTLESDDKGRNLGMDGSNFNIETDISGIIRFQSSGYSYDMLRLSPGGPSIFRNSVNNEDILRMNNSGGSNVEIPNGDLDLSGGSGDILLNKVDITSEGNITSKRSDGNLYLDIENGPGTIYLRDQNNNDIIRAEDSNNVNIPNGDLTVNNQLTVGSTECPPGSYIDGDGTCTDTLGEAADVYVNESGDTMEGNLDFNSYNITNLDTLKFEEGTSINGDLDVNGSIDTTGDLNMSDQNINNLQSIDGNGDAVRFDDNLDMNENELVNMDGLQDADGTNTIHFDGSNNVEILNGQLQMQDGSASTPAITFDNDADTGIYRGSTNEIRFSAGGSRVMRAGSSVFIDTNLDLVGNNIERVGGTTDASSGAIRLANGVSIQARNSGNSGDIQVIGTDSSDNVQIGGNGNINNFHVKNAKLIMNDNRIKDAGDLLLSDSGGSGRNWVLEEKSNDKFNIRSNSLNVIRAKEGGNVEVPNGNLDLQGNKVVDTTGSNSVTIGDGSDDSVTVDAGGSGSYSLRTGNNAGGSTERLSVTSSSGRSVIDVKNANLDLNRNNLKNVYSVTNGGNDINVNDSAEFNSNEIQGAGKVGVGTSTPSENLDVDGTASVSNSGTTMEVDSSGDVVVTLGS